MRTILVGVTDTAASPSPAPPMCSPLLYAESWRASLGEWLPAALAALPTADGIPSEWRKGVLLQTLGSLPDAFEGGGININLQEALREAIGAFAQHCRRMTSAEDFELACYEWQGAK